MGAWSINGPFILSSGMEAVLTNQKNLHVKVVISVSNIVNVQYMHFFMYLKNPGFEMIISYLANIMASKKVQYCHLPHCNVRLIIYCLFPQVSFQFHMFLFQFIALFTSPSQVPPSHVPTRTKGHSNFSLYN